ncbi:MAG: hypothetical protein ACRED8_06990 [Caulobacteraceae bacterium]
MRILTNLLLAGGAALALAGATGIAHAGRAWDHAQDHVLTLEGPGGGTWTIRYHGDVAPQARFTPGAGGTIAFSPFSGSFFAASPFAAMDRLDAQIDRQMAELMKQGALADGAAGLQQAGASRLPAGGESFQMTSSFGGGHACFQSVEITSQGLGKAPRVIRKSSGDCGAKGAPSAPTTAYVPASSASRTMPVSWTTPG